MRTPDRCGYAPQERQLHGCHLLHSEVASTQFDHGGHLEAPRLKELDGDEEAGHCHHLKQFLADGPGSQISVEVVDGDADNLPGEVKVIDDLIAPLHDLLPPDLIDSSRGTGGGGGRACGFAGLQVGVVLKRYCQFPLKLWRQVVFCGVYGKLLLQHDIETVEEVTHPDRIGGCTLRQRPTSSAAIYRGKSR